MVNLETRDILLGSHQAFRDDNRSGYDEGEHKCHNERHYTSISCYKYDEGEHEFHKERHYTLISCYKDEGIRILCNTHPTREEHNIVDQKRPTTNKIGEHSDIETKN